MKTEHQQVPNHQVEPSTRHTLQAPMERTSSHDFMKNIPTSVPENFLMDFPTISIPSPPASLIPSPPEISLSHLVDQLEAASESHIDMETENAPTVTAEEETPPVVGPNSEVDPVANPISSSPAFDVRSYCFSPDTDTEGEEETVEKVPVSNDTQIEEAEVENILEEIQGMLGENEPHGEQPDAED